MDPTLPADWQRLDAYDRDILVMIGQLNYPRGVDVWDHIADVDKRESQPRFYTRLAALVDRGYVDRHDDPNAPGATSRYELSTQAVVLLDGVGERFNAIGR